MIWIQIDSRINEYGLRKHATTEELEMRFSGMDGKTLLYGDRVLVCRILLERKRKPILLRGSVRVFGE